MRKTLVVAPALLASSLMGQSPPPTPPVPSGPGSLTVGGAIEGLYSWNLGNPSNRVTNARGFDVRSNSFALSNVMLDTSGEKGALSFKLTLQAGDTPDTYYASEPGNRDTWKHVQQAFFGYKAPVGRGILVQGGLFLSPIGPEGMAVKDNWNWSRSTLFFALPAYHAGIRATAELSDSVSLGAGVFNGWNDVVDNNTGKSLMVQVLFKGARNLNAQILYFGGGERPENAPEGQPWRHLFDAFASLDATDRLSLMAHANGGFEENRFGTSSWAGAALYARYRPSGGFFVTLRGDLFRESKPAGASAIFFPVDRVASATLTLDFRPVENLSIRLEGRTDGASERLYFKGAVSADPAGTFLPNAKSQTTLTLGATAWF